jgi:sulfite reductase (NADPH) hemoprotein beta-component
MGVIEPSFRTDPKDYSEVERTKIGMRGMRVDGLKVHEMIRDLSRDDMDKEVIDALKSFGIYLEFNRDKVKKEGQREKDYIYMIRVAIPGGGPLKPWQWRILDQLADRYTLSDAYTGETKPSLKLTTRQDIQFHHVKKVDLVKLIREIASSGFFSLNGCGDNVRNTMACPLSRYSTVFDGNSLARDIANYFKLPTGAYIQVFEIYPSPRLEERPPEGQFDYPENLLPRKFKIGISALVKGEDGSYRGDNCIEVRTNDIGVVPLLRDGKVESFQLYVGGAQGESNAYPSFSALGMPLGVVHTREELFAALDGVVRVQAEWGDRKNRHWARLKYLVYKMGIEWIREKVRETSGIDLDPPLDVDPGERAMHLGWIRQENKDRLCYGLFVENGRVVDGPNGRIKTMIRYIMDKYEGEGIEALITPQQHLLLCNIPEERKEDFEQDLRLFGYGLRNGRPYSRLRVNSNACVGFPTCKLSFTDSERFEPKLLDKLEERWGDLAESIGVSGCVAQCSRPATKAIGWVGSGYELYMLKIGGTTDGRYMGEPLIDPETGDVYLYQVPASEVWKVCNALIEFYLKFREPWEGEGKMGYFFRRVGNRAIINWLKSHPDVRHLMAPKKVPSKALGYAELHRLQDGGGIQRRAMSLSW